MKTILLTLGLTAALTAIGIGANIKLSWDAVCDPLVSGYNIYYSSNSLPTTTNIVQSYTDSCGNIIPTMTNVYYGTYYGKVTVVGITNNSVTISNLIKGVIYNFAATTYSTNGLESAYSAGVTYTIPAKPTNPSNLQAR